MNIEITEGIKEETKHFEESAWRAEDMPLYGEELGWSKDKYFFTAKVDGEVAGTVKGRIESGVLFIRDFIVGADYRGKGIGKMLLDKVEAYGESKGAHKYYIHVLKGCPAQGFYEKMGYELSADLPKHYHGKDFVLMAKYI